MDAGKIYRFVGRTVLQVLVALFVFCVMRAAFEYAGFEFQTPSFFLGMVWVWAHEVFLKGWAE